MSDEILLPFYPDIDDNPSRAKLDAMFKDLMERNNPIDLRDPEYKREYEEKLKRLQKK